MLLHAALVGDSTRFKPAGRHRGDLADHAAAARRPDPPCTSTRADPRGPAEAGAAASPTAAAGTTLGPLRDYPDGATTPTAEHARLAEATGRAEAALFSANPWYEWGPYLSERAWGTVREDYSDNGDAWTFFPYDQSTARAYRWSEDGLAGVSDIWQDICLDIGLWNGRDSHIKERLFGLTGHQGNHGEDVKEYYWYRDATPSHSWLRWRYHYPQAAFPYEEPRAGQRTPRS